MHEPESVLCPECDEEVYVGMMSRHMDKDHNPEDERLGELLFKCEQLGVSPAVALELVYG